MEDNFTVVKSPEWNDDNVIEFKDAKNCQKMMRILEEWNQYDKLIQKKKLLDEKYGQENSLL